ncbi:MAG: endonuclease/exonuclease/phosphatase family protein [Paludibacteraceae bacterium]|nr:endonuclease/exonuclease/phosphatase family protein [Paludibacteraceae bacterium]
MKKFLFVLLVLAYLSGYAEEAGVHRFATYNVRIATSTCGDKGEKNWANRRTYVAQNITGYDFDIVGLQEVINDYTVPNVGKSQLQDLRGLLSDYADYSVGQDGTNHEQNSIFYKKNKYTLLDKGRFFLNEHPEKAGKGWGGTFSRVCIWVHLRDKTSQQDFYFVCAHTNHGAEESSIQGARLISQRLREIAGNKPVILVGDFNMRRAEHAQAYSEYAVSLFDLALTTPEDQCLPADGPQITATTTEWTPAVQQSSGNEFDYIFYNRMEPLSRHIITEYYPDAGRTVNPSDHYPLLGRFRISSNPQTVIRATDETSLHTALSNAAMGDTILLTEGTYSLTRSLTPHCSVTISGGWDAAFTSQTGMSLLQPGGFAEPMISIPDYFNLSLDHLEISGANSTTVNGGAVVCSYGKKLALNDCYLHDNTTTKNGGTIVHKGESLLLKDCVFERNNATNGGAVWLQESDAVTIRNCRFVANNANSAGSAVEMTGCSVLDVQRCAFVSNTATTRGALDISPSAAPQAAHILNCAFLNNTLSSRKGMATATKRYGGAALWADMTANSIPLNIGLCTFMGNHTTFTGTADNFGGGALAVFKGKLCLMDNLILANDQKIGGAAPVWADLYKVALDVIIRTETDNLYSSSSEISGWENTIVDAFGGTLSGGQYIPKIKENGAYPIYQKILGTQSIACLPANKRMCESAFNYDLNGDGSISGSVTRDMVNRNRNLQSCVGAVEFTGNDQPEGIDQIKNDQSPLTDKIIENGQLIIIKNGIRYDASGNRL